MRKHSIWIVFFMGMVVTTACQDHKKSVTAPSGANNTSVNSSPTRTTETTAATSVTDKWMGKWVGPEGTFLQLSKEGNKYSVKIQSLDGAETYEGIATGDRIQFTRDGKTEAIRAGTGKETGMKWLLEEKNCLIIRDGEGFCRK